MAKFEVGEIAIMCKPDSEWNGRQVEVQRVGPFKKGDPDPDNPLFPIFFSHDYTVAIPHDKENVRAVLEVWLRKLPPDDHADDQDTTEDPGLTRIKKLLEQDQPLHKQPKRVKA